MSDHSIRSLNVEFPFQPYECQLTYMEKVVEALQTCQNALLESPTGTGKVRKRYTLDSLLAASPRTSRRLQTLSLLCAALSWQRAYGAALQLAKTHGWSAELADSADGKLLGGGVPVSPDTPLDQQQEAHSMRVDLRKAAGSLRLPPERRPLKQESQGSFGAGGVSVGGRNYTYGEESGGGQGADGEAKPVSVFDSLPHKPSVVIYSSRTHSQLSQVVKELKRTSFRPRVSVLGSRSQLCVHPKVAQMEGQMQSNACKALCKTRACMPRNNLNDFLALGNSVYDLPHAHWSSGKDRTLQVPRRRPKEDEDGNVPLGATAPLEPVVSDIEDLVSLGREKDICPYFAMREVAALEQAQLVLLPYNYLVDPAVRQSLDINWGNSVIIFDEGHNIESVAGDAASFDLSALDIAQCIQEMHSIAQAAAASTSDNANEADVTAFTSHFDAPGDADNVLILKNIFLMIEARLASEELPTEKDSPGAVFEGRYIYELMQSWNITFETHGLMDGLIGKCLEWLSSRDASAIGGGSISRGGREMGMAKFRKILARIFSSPETAEQLATNYKMVIHEKQPTGTGFGGRLRKAHRVLSYWCFSPGVAMHELQALGVRSFIVTSGTLAPMASYTAELQLPFPIQLENSHVIHPSQLMLRILERGPGLKTLSSAYENRNRPEYKEELGKMVVNLCRLVPNGMLVFFPSFSALRSCVEHWRLANGGAIWSSLKREKEPVVEGERSLSSASSAGSAASSSFGAAATSTHGFSGGAGQPKSGSSSSASNKAKQYSSGFAVVASDGSGGFGGGGGRGAGGGTRIIGRADVLSSFVPNIAAAKRGASSSQGDAFAEMIKKFNDNAGTERGAVLLAVCRGRASEGIDFSDAKARAVVITGIPYPPLHDAKVKLKRQHLDSRAKEQSMASLGNKSSAHKASTITLSGSDWYAQQAARAVNQAVGRVIRHRFDYGAIILADSRFASARGSSSAYSQLSRWLQPYISVASKYAELPRSLVQFYKLNARAEALRAQAARDAAGDEATVGNAAAAAAPQPVSMVPEDLIADLGMDVSVPQSTTVANTFGNAAAGLTGASERKCESSSEAFEAIAGQQPAAATPAAAPRSLRDRFRTDGGPSQPSGLGAASCAAVAATAPRLHAVAERLGQQQHSAASSAGSSLKALFSGEQTNSVAHPSASQVPRGLPQRLGGSFVDRMLKQQTDAAAAGGTTGAVPGKAAAPMGRAVKGGAFGLKRRSGDLPVVVDEAGAAPAPPPHPTPSAAPSSGPQQLIQDIRTALKRSTVMVRGVVLKSYSVFRDALQGMRAAKDDEHFLYNLRKCAQACHVVAGGTPGSPPSMPMEQRVQLMQRLVAQLPSVRRTAATALLHKLTGAGGVKSAMTGSEGSSASKRARTS